MTSQEPNQVVIGDQAARSRSDELSAFLFLTVVVAPVLAVGAVGGYGFLVWMSQLLTGPPGH